MDRSPPSSVASIGLVYRQIVFQGNGSALLRGEIKKEVSGQQQLTPVPKSIDVQSLKITTPDTLFLAQKRFVSVEELSDARSQIGETVVTIKGPSIIQGTLLDVRGDVLVLEANDDNRTVNEVHRPDVVQYSHHSGNVKSYLDVEIRERRSRLPTTNLDKIALSGTIAPAAKEEKIEMAFRAEGFSWEVCYHITLDFQNHWIYSLLCELTYQNRTEIDFFYPLVLSFLAKADERPRSRAIRGDYQMAAMAAPPSPRSEETAAGSALFTLGNFRLPARSSQSTALFQSSEMKFLSLFSYDIRRRSRHPERLVQFHPPKPPVETNGEGIYPGGRVFIWEGNELLTETDLAMQAVSGDGKSPFTFSLGEHAFVDIDTEIVRSRQKQMVADEERGMEQTLVHTLVNMTVTNRSSWDFLLDAYYPGYQEIRQFHTSEKWKLVEAHSPKIPVYSETWIVEPERYGHHVFVQVKSGTTVQMSMQFMAVE